MAGAFKLHVSDPLIHKTKSRNLLKMTVTSVTLWSCCKKCKIFFFFILLGNYYKLQNIPVKKGPKGNKKKLNKKLFVFWNINRLFLLHKIPCSVQYFQ